MRRIILAITLILAMTCESFAEDSQDYDPQNTMLALNMAIVSVHRILTTKDRLILDQEYQNIINTLSIGNIEADPEITSLYQKLMDISSKRKLRENELQLVKKSYDLQMQGRLSSSLLELSKNSGTILRDMSRRQTSTNLLLGVGRLIAACGASYFKYQNSGIEIRKNLDANLYRLYADDLEEFNDMQKKLLDSSWKLLRKYSLPDEYRLVQKAMDDYYSAVEEPDEAPRKLRMLKALEDDFKVYPPYWYYRAKTAQDAAEPDEANKCFDKFDEVWRPVLRQDPYKLEVTKYRFSQLVQNENFDSGSDSGSRTQALNLLAEMRKNTLREDWLNNIFAGTCYYSLGEFDEAVKCVEINVDFGYEHDLSDAMLYAMRKKVAPENLPADTLRARKLNELLEKISDESREAALAIADYFDARPNALEYIQQLHSENANPLLTHAMRISEFRKNDPSEFENIFELMNLQIESKDNIPISYAGFVPMVRNYADDGNVLAQIFLADMYQYGWGVAPNKSLAVNYYQKAASQDIYAQIMYVNDIFSGQKYRDVAVFSVPDSKKISQDLKPKAKPKSREKTFWQRLNPFD